MTDVELLKKKIDEQGYKLKFIASKIGITYQALLNKLNNDTEFKASEIGVLSRLLKLSARERDAIFFANTVATESTKH